MYFPYLRGRQYELLALKELVSRNLISNLVFPVVELIKNTSTLQTTLKTFADNHKGLALIINPTVGELTNDFSHVSDFLKWFKECRETMPAVIMGKNDKRAIHELEQLEIKRNEMVAIIKNRDQIDTYNENFKLESPKFLICPDERAIRREIHCDKVMLEDKFNKLNKNADYEGNEFYSDDHLYYKEERYVGFSDFSIVGSDYSESGFAPYAVAIHIVYFDDKKILRVAHFVSDSNDDISDVAGKFYEAVKKLESWVKKNNITQRTYALDVLLSHAENGYYPGLPTIKKLSIMHHLELMSKYLDGEE